MPEANVPPILSDDRTAFARRQIVGSLTGGLIISGVPLKAVALQLVLLLWPAVVILTLAAVSAVDRGVRSVVAGVVCGLIFAAVEGWRTFVCRAGGQGATKAAVFSDYDAGDFSRLFSAESVSYLLPPRRYPCRILRSLLSFGIGFFGVMAFDFETTKSSLDMSLTAAAVLATLATLVSCVVEYSVISGQVPCPARYRPLDSCFGILEFSRGIQFCAVLGMTEAVPELRYLIIALPLLWAAGVIPQMDAMLQWVLEYAGQHVLGGSPMPSIWQLVFSMVVSIVLIITGAAMPRTITTAFVAIAAFFVGTNPLIIMYGKEFHAVVTCRFVMMAAAGLGVGLAIDVQPAARLALAHVALALALFGLLPFRWTSTFLTPAASPSGFHFDVRIGVLRIFLVACVYAWTPEVPSGWSFESIVQVVFLFRVFQEAARDPARCAVAIWGWQVLEYVSAESGSPTTVEYPVGLAIASWVVHVALGTGDRLHYAAHLTFASMKLPKLRHALVRPLAVVNLLCLPVLAAEAVLCAALDAPLMAVFSLPLFLFSYPRPARGPAADQPVAHGVEGKIYEILAQSLMPVLAPMWRTGAISTRPGTMLLCASHEKLTTIVHVIASGAGWVAAEVRGLELMDPTSCHHLEAGIIQSTFQEHFNPAPPRDGKRDIEAGDDVGRESTVSAPKVGMFVLQPKAAMPGVSTYEASGVSLRGLIDNRATLKMIHTFFFHGLLYLLSQTKRVNPAWTGCPVEERDFLTAAHAFPVGWARHLGVQPPATALARQSPSPDADALFERVTALPHSSFPGDMRPEQESPRQPLPSHELDVLDNLMDEIVQSNIATVPSRCDTDVSPRGAVPPPMRVDQTVAAPQGDAAALPADPSICSDGPNATIATKLYAMFNVAMVLGHAPEGAGPAHVFRLFSGEFLEGSQDDSVKWLREHPALCDLVIKAFRYGVKLGLDLAVLGEESCTLSPKELEQEFQELEQDWWIGGEDCWNDAIDRKIPSILSLQRVTSSEYRLTKFSFREDLVNVGTLRNAAVMSAWASISLELNFFANDDEERYSIQAHPSLLRNLMVQVKEYPIFVSKPLVCHFE
mmetsp:Transcript_53129/g.121356  ORF Transcript_53129/g.121356 Transcript_53129/m.121356 type:complete len:1082 (+) Transcript_53129:108-3353(+)|eukprot:CAMPEP_0204375296 /NCGR_PEP_ID=MMETSP0469-20131031/49126_1 /ASSEMBLY_ACC=CAM_ASM_000384 /TAXON_ID=2969 /ORGANISM="Oxyrrhis marina" /LENGTH=1081 /DNA_ID=CAMNT_0051365959 /DNA_START=62 /DNA_END=3307 /DNA_ORIENTATION=+